MQEPSPNAPSMLGQVLHERYRLTRLLGQGGMGEVYAAEHVKITKKVAIKLLHPEISANPEAVARFEQEAVSASGIGHENIIGIDDFFTLDDGRVCLCMEFLEGESLSDAMSVPGGLDPLRAIDIMVQVCAGLGAAHAKGIVHRDMKPENVFLTRRPDGREIVKILDFGIAKVTGNEDNNLTKTGTVFGTPHYMSPEQALGHKVDHRADIYSLGVMLFEIFTGQVPFQAESFMGVLSQHITSPPPSPSTMTPGRAVPKLMEDIILRAMAKEVDQRFPDTQQLADTLLAFRQGIANTPSASMPVGRSTVAGFDPSSGSGAAAPSGGGQASVAAAPTAMARPAPGGAPPPAGGPASPAQPAPQPAQTPIPKTMVASAGQQATAGAAAAAPAASVPSAPAAAVPSAAAAPMASPEKTSKLGLIIGIVAGVLVLGGGGAAAAVFWDDIMGSSELSDAEKLAAAGAKEGENGAETGGQGSGSKQTESTSGSNAGANTGQGSKSEQSTGTSGAGGGAGEDKQGGDENPSAGSKASSSEGDSKQEGTSAGESESGSSESAKADSKHGKTKHAGGESTAHTKHEKSGHHRKTHAKQTTPKQKVHEAAAPPKPKECKVKLRSRPGGAAIFAGGRRIGRTPRTFTLKPGQKRRVKLAKGGFRDHMVTVSCDRTDHVVRLRKGIGRGKLGIPDSDPGIKGADKLF